MTSYEDQGVGYDPHASGHELQGRRSLTEAPEAEAVEPVACDPGHCSDDAAWEEVSARYLPMKREQLCGGDMTDFALANHVFMSDRMSLDLMGAQLAAKDRIRWLSVQLAASRRSPPTIQADLDRAVEALTEARDLLLERIHGSPARSAAHNARVRIEAALATITKGKP